MSRIANASTKTSTPRGASGPGGAARAVCAALFRPPGSSRSSAHIAASSDSAWTSRARPASRLARAAASSRRDRSRGSGASVAARSRNAAAAANPPRVCARAAACSSSPATSSSGIGVACARCQARRSGSTVGSMTSARARCTSCRSRGDAEPYAADRTRGWRKRTRVPNSTRPASIAGAAASGVIANRCAAAQTSEGLALDLRPRSAAAVEVRREGRQAGDGGAVRAGRRATSHRAARSHPPAARAPCPAEAQAAPMGSRVPRSRFGRGSDRPTVRRARIRAAGARRPHAAPAPRAPAARPAPRQASVPRRAAPPTPHPGVAPRTPACARTPDRAIVRRRPRR